LRRLPRDCVRVALPVTLALGLAPLALAQDLPEADRAAIRAVNEAYRAAWLANDSAAVMRTLTDDAVLIPHHGVAPVEGAAAIRDFWWPADGPPTTITEFSLSDQRIAGNAELAYVRGRFSIGWIQVEPDGGKRYGNEGNFLSILRRGPDGAWRIALQAWSDPPNQLVESASARDP
jgi:uncharacterized protein (TIGR02246 family)